MTKFVLFLIRIYQKFLPKSELGCRFNPTCSRYSYQAFQKYGILHGSLYTIRRVARCHPWHPGGYDPLT